MGESHDAEVAETRRGADGIVPGDHDQGGRLARVAIIAQEDGPPRPQGREG
jgi:hypothetical protein